MKKLGKFAALALLTISAASAAFAQAPGAGGNPQFAQFREQHKFTFQLMQMVRHIGIIDRDPKYALTSAQAKKVVAVLKPLRTKPKLTEDQARDTLKSLKPIFTVKQLNGMAKIKAPPRRFSGQRPGGGFGRPGGQGGPGGNRPPGMRRFDPARMKDFNPFYSKVSKSDPMSADRAKMWNDFFSRLDAKAKGQKVPLAKAAAKPAKPKK